MRRKFARWLTCISLGAISAVALAGCELFGIKLDTNIEYCLTFHTNADTEDWEAEVKKPEDIRMPDDPVKENYIFDGWFWDDGVWEKPFTALSILDQPISQRMELNVYAKWKGVPVEISFEDNLFEPIETEYGELFDLPEPTGAEGDIFYGWRVQTENGDGEMLTDEDGVSLEKCDFTEAITVEPVWKEGRIVLSFDTQGGAEEDDLVVWKGEKYGALPTPKKENYEFLGWYTALDGGEKIEKGMTVELETDTTLYARWEKNLVMTVSYDGNGADSGSMTSQTKINGGAVTLSKNAFIKTGYSFVGWECGGKTYAPEQTLEFSEGAYVMKAVWEAHKYTVVFGGAHDGYTTMSAQAFTYGAEQKLSNNQFVKTGYAFAGWKKAGTEDSELLYTDGQTVKNLTAENGGTVELHAVWTPISYTVYIKAEKDTPNREAYTLRKSYDESFNLSTNSYRFTKEGYYQTGWKVVSGMDEDTVYALNQDVSNLTSAQNGEIAIVPTWEVIRYTLQYIARIPGSGVGYILGTYELSYFDEHTLMECTHEREGYYGGGWTFEGGPFSPDALNPDYEWVSLKVGDTVSGLSIENEGTVYAVVVWEAAKYVMRAYANDGSGLSKDFEAKYKSATSLGTDWMTGKGENYEFAGFVCGTQRFSTYARDNIARKNGEVVELYALWKYKFKGSGTEADPYLIDCAEAMENMAVASFADTVYYDYTCSSKVHFRFTADIDMTGRKFTPIGWYENSSFYGSIDGNGHTVYGLNIVLPADKSTAAEYATELGVLNRQTRVGFVCKAEESTIKNLRFENAKMTVDGGTWLQYAGFLYGTNYKSVVENVAVIDGNMTIVSDGVVPIMQYTGVDDALYVGGIGGYSSSRYETLKNCCFTGEINVVSPKSKIGGIATGAGSFIGCAANAVITVEGSAECDGGADITQATVGGLGVLVSNAVECYSVAKVYSTRDKLEFIGTVAANAKTSRNVYYSDASAVETLGVSSETAGVGAEIADANLRDTAWVAENLPMLRTAEWTMENGYSVKGRRALTVVEISTKEAFLALAGKNLTEKYVLTADIDMSKTAWTPASVYGVFDGNGHTIDGLNVATEGKTQVGLFAVNYGEIKNLKLNASVSAILLTADGSLYVGGLVGYSEGEIAYCGVTGTVNGETVDAHVYVGGIAGYNVGEIYCSYTECELNGIATETETASTYALIQIKKGKYYAKVCGIAYSEEDKGTVKSCYTTGAYNASAVLSTCVAGVSNVAEASFSFADLTYNADASEHRYYAVGGTLKGCSSQTINGEAVSGNSETMFKSESYLTETLGMEAYTEGTDLSKSPYAAWVFTTGELPKLYFE